MRQHRRLILALTLALVIVPFVIWGGYAGRGGPDGAAMYSGPLVKVGSREVPPGELIGVLQSEEARQRKAGNKEVSFATLREDGTVERVLRQLTNRALIEEMAEKMNLSFDQSLLVETLKRDASFQDSEGKFDPEAWNRFLEQNKQRNWNSIYENVSSNLRMSLASSFTYIGGRILESEVKNTFAERYGRLRLNYVEVRKPVDIPESELRAHYEQNKERYRLGKKVSVAYAAFSLEPPKPAQVDEILTRARNGENFAALAQEFSDAPTAVEGGDLGWLLNVDKQPFYRRALYSAAPGSVLDPIWADDGFRILKLDAVRTNGQGQKEVRAREIVISALLPQAEVVQLMDRAKNLLERAKASSLEQAAKETGFKVSVTPLFDATSPASSGLPAQQALNVLFRTMSLEAGQLAEEVISAGEAFYVAQLVSSLPADIPAFEDVKDKVFDELLQQRTGAPEYQQAQEELIQDIASKAKSLEDVVKLHPELNLTIQEGLIMSPQIFVLGAVLPTWKREDVYNQLKDQPAGAFVGPIQGLGDIAYFVQVTDKLGPSPKNWEKDYPEQRERLRSDLAMMQAYEYGEDYMQYLYLTNANRIERNEDMLNAILRIPAAPASDTAGATGSAEGTDAPAAQTSVPEGTPEAPAGS